MGMSGVWVRDGVACRGLPVEWSARRSRELSSPTNRPEQYHRLQPQSL